jgi:hypothetical protein
LLPAARARVKRKFAIFGKVAASVITAEPKGKKMKVLTHRPRYIEPTVIPEFDEGASSVAKIIQIASTALGAEEPVVMPKVLTAKLVKTKIDKAKKPKVEETMKMQEILSLP